VQRIRSISMILSMFFCLGLFGSGHALALGETNEPPNPERTVRVHAGQSVLIDTSFPIKRVSVAKPEIADVEVISPKQLMAIGKGVGKTTLIYWDESEVPTSSTLIVEIDLDLAEKELRKIVPGESFDLAASGDTLILTGTVSSGLVAGRLLEGARALGARVTDLLEVVKPEQVLLQIRVAEINRSLMKELGFNAIFRPVINGGSYRGFWSPPGSFHQPFGSVGDLETPDMNISDLTQLFVATPGAQPKFAAMIRVLHDKGALKTLAEPNLVVASGAEGKFLVGGEFPIVTLSAAGTGAAASIQYKEYGVKLDFKPTIASNGDIFMQVMQEVSELDFANAVSISGFQVPSIRSRKAQSGLQLGDGQTFVLAGLLDSKIQKKITKIPLLGDIPILGALFRNVRYQDSETELMVMVTPKIVRPLNKEEIPTLPTERMDSEETNSKVIW